MRKGESHETSRDLPGSPRVGVRWHGTSGGQTREWGWWQPASWPAPSTSAGETVPAYGPEGAAVLETVPACGPEGAAVLEIVPADQLRRSACSQFRELVLPMLEQPLRLPTLVLSQRPVL